MLESKFAIYHRAAEVCPYEQPCFLHVCRFMSVLILVQGKLTQVESLSQASVQALINPSLGG